MYIVATGIFFFDRPIYFYQVYVVKAVVLVVVRSVSLMCCGLQQARAPLACTLLRYLVFFVVR